MHPERITKPDKRLVNDPDHEDIKFPVSKKEYCNTKQKHSICMNVFSDKNNVVYLVYVLDNKFDCMDLLLITDETKLYYVYIKDFN